MTDNKQKKISFFTTNIAAVIVIVIAINVISGFLYFKADLTSENLYTLSKGSTEILEKLDDEMIFKFYFSKGIESVPMAYKTYAKRVQELLEEYRDRSGNRLRLEVYDPKPDTEDEEWAIKSGIQGAQLPSGEKFYLGLVSIMGTHEKNIPFFDPRREEFLEFDITQLIFQTQQTQKPKLGIMSMLPVFGSSPELEGVPGFQGRSEPWVFIEELKKSFDVEKVESNVETIDSKFTSLLVIHPKNLAENTEKAIDQFILRGGKAMIFFDPSASQDPSEQMNPFQQQQPPSRFGLLNLFRAWGVEFAADQIVADSKYATMVNSQGGNVRYPLWLMLNDKEAITEKEIITSELKNILLVTPGAIKTTGNDYQVRPLLKSSPKSQLFNKMMAGYMQPLDLMQQLKPDNEAKVLAAILEGQFKTAFPNETKAGWLKNTESNNAVFLVADTDLLFDNYMIRKFNFLGQTISQPLNDNLAMIMNAADFLGGSSALISIRSRGKFARPFTKVQDIETKAQEKWQKEEEMLTQKLNAVQKRINDLQAQKEDGSKLVLSQAQLEEVKKFREEEANTKKSRREIRKILREDVDNLGTILTIINVTLIPLIVSAFGFLAFRRRIQMASSGRQ